MEIDKMYDLVPEIGYFVYRKCTPDWMLIEETIDSMDIVYLIDGTATYTINNKSYYVKKGDVLYIPRKSVRSAYTYPDNLMECYSISFQMFDKVGEEGFLPLPTVNHIGIQPDLISLYGDLNNSWLRRNPGYIIKTKAIFMLILSRYYEIILHKDDFVIVDQRIDKAVRFITDNYFENITIDDVSKLTGLHPNYFGLLFKKATGLSFRQFLTDIRINHAENLLKIGHLNITEIAERCGFPDACYFSRIFKKRHGIPPSKAVM